MQAEIQARVCVGSRPPGFGLLDLFLRVIVSFFSTSPIAYQTLCLRLIDCFPGRGGLPYRSRVPGDSIIKTNVSFLCRADIILSACHAPRPPPPLFDAGGWGGGVLFFPSPCFNGILQVNTVHAFISRNAQR